MNQPDLNDFKTFLQSKESQQIATDYLILQAKAKVTLLQLAPS
ncbi:hypothetical protein ACQ4M3_35270 [Leptolyngbya sp. AN03gr2]